MIGIEIKDVKTVQKRFENRIELQRTSARDALRNINDVPFNPAEKAYLAQVIDEFDKRYFLTSEPQQLNHLVAVIGKIPKNSLVKGQDSLKDLIIRALDYSGLRSNFYPEYFREIGIKACVYCNSQLTITVERKKRPKVVARFDVDHYRAKDDYPFLAISLFNLYPVCSSCNRQKSKQKIYFDLYTDGPKKASEFRFILDTGTKAKYLTNFDVNEIEFRFTEPEPPSTIYRKLEHVFSVQAIHNTQKDVIGELMIKSHIYNSTNKQQLRESFRNISLDEKLFERVIVGNYVDDKDIHRRPFSKLVMDIAKDLKIID